ncbi:MAG: hypothetical protein KBD29_02465 [Candidatus Magasanikbacteria bacterium]|nr:hypothetical protein [Candidatus Magasanikbacteria bacterium]
MLPTEIGPLTQIDIETITKNRKKDLLRGIFLLFIFGLIQLPVYYQKFDTFEISGAALIQNVPSVILLALSFIILIAIIHKRRLAEEDISEGRKEIFIGPILKKIKKDNGKKHYFYINDTRFPIEEKTYNLYQENDTIQIERAPKSLYTLSTSTVSGTSRHNS